MPCVPTSTNEYKKHWLYSKCESVIRQKGLGDVPTYHYNILGNSLISISHFLARYCN